MAEKMTFAGWSAVLATWIGIGGAVAGGYRALETYEKEVAKMEDARVVQTFALFDMFNNSERLHARQRIFDHIHNEGTAAQGEELSRNDVYIFVDFFDALQICVERDLCDRDLSKRLFQSYAAPVWDELGTVITASRDENDPEFGSGLEWMASLDREAAAAQSEQQSETSAQEETPTTTP
ncbi:hypothetical protein [Terricaulis sp.]|uniref:DUF4760 domain-containing protein n=1 Tax=Terricaulis sp. TaxID=2768686 RepID=UPI003782E2CD